jgi:hypothetical protein
MSNQRIPQIMSGAGRLISLCPPRHLAVGGRKAYYKIL